MIMKVSTNCFLLKKKPRNAIQNFWNKLLIQMRMFAGVGGRVNHPIHLHGFGFQVIDMGTMEQYRTGQTAYANSTALPPIKDTVTVPAGGFARIRFRSCNPGFWFFHCHFEYHMHTGMNGIIKVGNKKDMVPPPSGFPTCGDYFAPVWDDQSNSQTKTITQTSTIVTTS